MAEYLLRILIGGLAGFGIGSVFFLVVAYRSRGSTAPAVRARRIAGHYGKWVAIIIGALPLKDHITGYAGGSGLAVAAWLYGGAVMSVIVFLVAYAMFKLRSRAVPAQQGVAPEKELDPK
jgi:hypothetical protein